ncbi:glycosyltransferase family 2 protein [Campylobacter sp. TTU-622]|uniref:glycosyltransferase family 2 protein n=1 Tax=unclassified Campylobacter TaxID=2593542 RepID=UPI001907B631|nr:MULTISPECIES: glycosyltransferase family 2 protein [unclassified Campylobacter]MBK1971570.1 glycosyltransferase family 2 protein [Campylobacter sp. TTU_617]MBK1973835.1 glycosyltransferase family 2 protein [Campylobacter sp. TTU-622]MBK1991483.1 glycosyltransferase family 2 protein [Campylobacter sp. 2018MI34]
MPQISIILPTFNVEKYIKKALDSCINQSLKDIEIIVVDDLGSDNSINIAKEEALKDKRIKIIHNEKNLGTFASRNVGVLNSSSAYIMFLDPDDTLALNACELALKEIKDFDLICFDALVHRVNTKQFYRFKQNENFNQSEFLNFLLQQRHFCWSVWAKLFKKDMIFKVFQKINPYEKLSYSEDMFFCYMYFMQCEKIRICKELVYYYEFNENGRYESKKFLYQNYLDKQKSFKFIKEFSLEFKNDIFHKNLFEILEKELNDLKNRLDRIV